MADTENIYDFSPEELAGALAELGEPEYRARQVFDWLYKKLVFDFNKMSNLPAGLRQKLAAAFNIPAFFPEKTVGSADGTKKFRYRLLDGSAVESVLMPGTGPGGKNRFTLCVSSQAGCPLGCRFCMTGKNGFRRNLEAAEIVGQVVSAVRGAGRGAGITNLVFMGMGEPFLNYDNVVRALGIITSPDGLAYSPGRITVSTAGIADRLAEFGNAGLAELAVSLNAPDDETRTMIMPVNKKYPLKKLLGACRGYPAGPQKKITFEYVLLREVNDSPSRAEKLARLLAGLHCKINLIPFNECEGLPFRSPESETVEKFRKILVESGIEAFVRASRGSDIAAACGQLAGK